MIGDTEGRDLYMTPVGGFRVWRISPDGQEPKLLPLIADVPGAWSCDHDEPARCISLGAHTQQPKPGTCQKGGRPVNAECSCGVYGYWSYDDLRGHPYGWASASDIVRGVVCAWGRVVLAEKGFRAEYARPAAFLAWPERREQPRLNPGAPASTYGRGQNHRIALAAERYGVPLVGLSELLDIAASYPRPV